MAGTPAASRGVGCVNHSIDPPELVLINTPNDNQQHSYQEVGEPNPKYLS